MPYPIILNADHAEFEREHANTKPEDRPDWPLRLEMHMTNYQKGYEAGLNGWRFDMTMKSNQEYLDGWNAGWKKRYFRTRVEG